ncbi:hypothetical protein Tco_0541109 [Tanacetum coccineum]
MTFKLDLQLERRFPFTSRQGNDLEELLLKLINDLQILKGIQQEKKKPTAQSSIPYWNSSMIDDEEARDNFLKDVCTFLRKFSHALMDKQYRQEDIQELMSKLLKDVRNISEEFSEYINCPSWNRPLFFDYDDDDYTIIYSKSKAITPDEPIEEPDNSLSMGDEHLDTISSVEILVPIPSELEGISDDTDDDDFEDVEYVSLEEVNDDHDEKEFDLEDILQIQDVILREKLLKVHRLISKIESLKVNSTPDRVLESPSSFPISVSDSDSFLEEGGGVWWDWRSDSTTTHVNYSLPEYESFHFDNSSFSSVPVLPESYSLMYVEICLNFESDTPVIDNFEKLNEDQRGSKNVLFQNVR